MTSKQEPKAYAELAQVIVALPVLVRENRRRRGLSERAAAKELGMSPSTVHRIEQGEDYNSRSIPTLLLWLGRA